MNTHSHICAWCLVDIWKGWLSKLEQYLSSRPHRALVMWSWIWRLPEWYAWAVAASNERKNTFVTTKICVFSSFSSFCLIWNLFLPLADPLPPFPLPCLSLLGGGIMWSSGELNTGAEAAAARWIIDGNLGVTRLGLLTSLLLHLTAGLTRQKGGREGEGERKRGGVHCLVGGRCLPLSPAELWMERQLCSNQC